MDLNQLKSVYFIGIGGIGMSSLARYFKALGKKVGGYDKTQTALTDELIRENMDVHFDDKGNAPDKQFLDKDSCLVVYTPAIPKDHGELNFFLSNGFNVMKRSAVLGLITKNHFTIAVAGTHGKTTTSSMVAHILYASGINCTAFLGGIPKNYSSNLLLPKDGFNESIIVVEADEYDRSFLTLHPDIAVITSMDADHLDIYGDKNYMEESYRMFAAQVKRDGLLLSRTGLPIGEVKATQQHYSLASKADYSASSIVVKGHRYYFDWHGPTNDIENLSTQMPGRHNVENVVAAIAVATRLNISPEKISRSVHSYTGVKRRFDYQVESDEFVYIDDYAHHPEELRACIMSAKELYKGKKITGIFQPHLFSRTRDFADGFGKSLSLLDELILLDIYPARELPIAGVTSKMIFDLVSIPNKTLCRKEDVLDEMKARKVEVLLTLGAGDIDQLVDPLKKFYTTGKDQTNDR
jgi:UDP-N-acetylmuramate--alanine ligase